MPAVDAYLENNRINAYPKNEYRHRVSRYLEALISDADVSFACSYGNELDTTVLMTKRQAGNNAQLVARITELLAASETSDDTRRLLSRIVEGGPANVPAYLEAIEKMAARETAEPSNGSPASKKLTPQKVREAKDKARLDGLQALYQLRALEEGAQEFDESEKPGYTIQAPPSETAEPSAASGMGDDFNTTVKTAKAENLARAKPRPSTHQLATYKALVLHVDLLNPELSVDERLRRARRLVRAYERVRERKPKFHDDGPQLRAARSLINRFQYQQKLKEAAPKLALG